MGKKIRAQRKGRSPLFRSAGKSVAPAFIPPFDKPTKARVVELLHNPGRGAPLARLVTDEGVEFYINAVEGLYVGQVISIYEGGEPSIGDIRKLKDIPPGTIISHVEKYPNDGGKFARASGTYAQVIGPTEDGIEVLLPSGKSIVVHPECRAVIGNVAGGGRVEKP
ncbi:MAG: 50S ribosomal protein L2, partial [Candidatus Geothermarchaeota archaeon]